MMGTVIGFPVTRRPDRSDQARPPAEGLATIVILPVVRIERMTEDPSDRLSSRSNATGRKRRRRARRP